MCDTISKPPQCPSEGNSTTVRNPNVSGELELDWGQMLGPQTKMLDLCPREGRHNQASQQQKTGLSTTKQTVFSVEIMMLPSLACIVSDIANERFLLERRTRMTTASLQTVLMAQIKLFNRVMKSCNGRSVFSLQRFFQNNE